MSWRKVTAAKEDLSAYLILTNATLFDVARENPKNLGELANISGIGAKKIKKYGRKVLNLLKK